MKGCERRQKRPGWSFSDTPSSTLSESARDNLLAILQDEPERRAFNEAIEAADSLVMSVASFVEASIVVEVRYGAKGLRDLDLFLDRAGIELAPVDVAQAREARLAFSRFGKGRHAARLNYGCHCRFSVDPL